VLLLLITGFGVDNMLFQVVTMFHEIVNTLAADSIDVVFLQ